MQLDSVLNHGSFFGFILAIWQFNRCALLNGVNRCTWTALNHESAFLIPWPLRTYVICVFVHRIYVYNTYCVYKHMYIYMLTYIYICMYIHM